MKKGVLLNNSSELIKRVEPYRCRRRPPGKGGGGAVGLVGGGGGRLRGGKAAFKEAPSWDHSEAKRKNKAKRPRRLERLFDVLICCTFAPSFLFRTHRLRNARTCDGGWRLGGGLMLASDYMAVCVCVCALRVAHQSIKYGRCNLLPCRSCFIIH